jgi:AcrR family transcriptional regulator
MARPSATPEQRAEVRKKIQRAAAGIYRREGLAAINARAIATEAGVSVGAIYAHFGDLPGLMRSLWTDHVERQNQAFRGVAVRHADPVERLRALLKAYLDFGIENAALYRSAFLFVRPESQQSPSRVPLDAYDFPRLMLEALKEGQALRAILAGDPAIQAQLLWSGVHGCLALPNNVDIIALAPAASLATPMIDALIDALRP